MIRFYAAPLSHYVRVLRTYRTLLFEMTKREISDQYSGQLLGPVWAILHPLMLMGLFIFLFAVVFQQKVGGTREMPLDYTAYILSGLIPWMAIQACLARACTGFTSQANLVKQVVFPTEVIPTKLAVAGLVPEFVGLAVLFIYILLNEGHLPVSYLALPLVVFWQLLLMIGLSFGLSVVGAFFKDTKDIIVVLSTYGLYLVPVVYLPTWIPEVFRPAVFLNPFSYAIWCFQDVLYFGRIEHPLSWIVFPVLSTAVFIAGHLFFCRLRPFLGNVL